MAQKKKTINPPLTYELFLTHKRDWKQYNRGFNPEYFVCSQTDYHRLIHELASKSGNIKTVAGNYIVCGVIVLNSSHTKDGEYSFLKDKYDYVR